MGKPFDLEAAKAGKLFRVRPKIVSARTTSVKQFVGITSNGSIVWESATHGIWANHPEELEMLPEKRVYNGLLVSYKNSQNQYVFTDTTRNREIIEQTRGTILKEFTVEYEE